MPAVCCPWLMAGGSQRRSLQGLHVKFVFVLLAASISKALPVNPGSHSWAQQASPWLQLSRPEGERHSQHFPISSFF